MSQGGELFEGKFIFSLFGHNVREYGKSFFFSVFFLQYSVNIFIILYTIIHEVSIVQ